MTFAGIVVTALIIGFWRKPVAQNEDLTEEDGRGYDYKRSCRTVVREERELFTENHIYVDVKLKIL